MRGNINGRLNWAEGMGLSEDSVERLTAISESASARGFTGYLPPGDVWSWALELDTAGMPDLADRVREIERSHGGESNARP